MSCITERECNMLRLKLGKAERLIKRRLIKRLMDENDSLLSVGNALAEVIGACARDEVTWLACSPVLDQWDDVAVEQAARQRSDFAEVSQMACQQDTEDDK